MAELIFKQCFDLRATLAALKKQESVLVPYGTQSITGMRSVVCKHAKKNKRKYTTEETGIAIKITRIL